MFAHMPIVRDILYGAASQGAELKDLCASINITPDELTDSEKSVSFEQAYRAWELAVKQTGDPLLGLHLGETSTPSILGLIGHLMQSSEDLLTAYQQVCKHAALATDMFQYSIEIKEKETALCYRPAERWMSISSLSAKQAVEQAMSGTLNVFYLLSGKKVTPVRAELVIGKPKSTHEYERVLGSVGFSKKRNALIFKTTDLKLPVLGYDKSLFALFDKIIREKLATLKRKNSLIDTVQKILTEEFNGRIVPAEMVATHLAMSVRTFQRRLSEEGISYRELASRIRKEIAVQLLKKPDARVTDVARMLGYSEASALRKALKG